jgi:hypothetical protein
MFVQRHTKVLKNKLCDIPKLCQKTTEQEQDTLKFNMEMAIEINVSNVVWQAQHLASAHQTSTFSLLAASTGNNA